MKFIALTVLLIGGLLAGCDRGEEAPKRVGELPIPQEAQPKLQTIKLWIGAAELEAEMALTDQERRTGMMFRKSMGENEGMLFVFPVAHQTGFWMKNTFVPLSAAYIDPSGVILEIHKLEPQNTNEVRAASSNILYVLETPQGWFERHNIRTGAVVRTEHGPLARSFSSGR